MSKTILDKANTGETNEKEKAIRETAMNETAASLAAAEEEITEKGAVTGDTAIGEKVTGKTAIGEAVAGKTSIGETLKGKTIKTDFKTAESKARNALFTVIISLVLLSVPVYMLIIKDRPRFSMIEYRQYAYFPVPTVQNVMDGQFQGQFETALNDQFPKRDLLLSLDFAMKRIIARLAYAPTGDRVVPLTDKSDSPLLYKRPGMDVVLPQPQSYYDSHSRAIIEQAAAFRDIMERIKNTNFHVYLVENIYSSAAHPAVEFYPNAARGRYADTFLKNAPEGLKVGLFRLDSPEDYEKYYFRTDHHWNGPGAWKVYNDVYNLLAESWPGIGRKLENHGFKTYDRVRFRGAYSRKAAYPDVYDIISEPVVDLPEYTVLINGVPGKRSNREAYLAGNFSRQTYFNHYAEIFGLDYGQVEYRMKNSAERNLLIIGPSFTQTMEILIASHYASTYVIDLRYYERDMKKKFDITEFIAEKDIDDVLFIIEPQSFLSKEWQVR